MKIIDHREENHQVPVGDLPVGAYFDSGHGEIYVIRERTEKSIRVWSCRCEYTMGFPPADLVTPLIVRHIEELHIEGEGVE